MSANVESFGGLPSLPPRSKPSLRQIAITGMSIASGGLLSYAILNLLDGSWLQVGTEAVLIGGSATLVSYAVNIYAIERGARLAAVGYKRGAVFSIAPMLALGMALSITTFAGLAYKGASERALEAHGSALTDYVTDHSRAASKAGGVSQTLGSIVSDARDMASCEARASCVSGNGAGGVGPVARILNEIANRAQSVASEAENSRTVRNDRLGRLEALMAEYHEAEGSSDLSLAERRGKLRQVDLRIRQAVSELDAASPVPMVRAFAEELSGGVVVPDRPDLSRKLSALGRDRAANLKATSTASEGEGKSRAPTFPGKLGISEVLSYAPHFLPFAAIAAAVEMLAPFTIWMMTFLTYRWAIDRIAPPPPARPNEEEEAFERLFVQPERADDDEKGAPIGKRPNGRFNGRDDSARR